MTPLLSRLTPLLIALLLWAATAPAARLSDDPSSRLSTIPHNAELQKALRESGIAGIAVRHEGWNETLLSWSRIKLHDLTGRTRIHGQDPVFLALGILYQPAEWQVARILPIEHPRVGEMLGINDKWTSAREVIESPGNEALRVELQGALDRRTEMQSLRGLLGAVRQAQALGTNRPGVIESVAKDQHDPRAISDLLADPAALAEAHSRRRAIEATVKQEKPFLEAGLRLLNRTIQLTHLGDEFLIVPDTESETGAWIAAHEARNRPAQQASLAPVSVGRALDLPAAASDLDQRLADAFQNGNLAGLVEGVQSFRATVDQSRHYPTREYLAQKNFYVTWSPSRMAAWLYGLAAVLFGLFLFFRAPGWRLAATTILCAALVSHTMGLVLRLMLTGHMPVSNMYESIVFTTWAAMVFGAAIEIWKRKGVVGLLAAGLGFLALTLVSLMPLHETRIHPLRAVLNSYWLNIHVTMMLVSYGAFAVAALFAGGYLVKSLTGREALLGGRPMMQTEQMELFAYRLVQVGWPLLTVGILLGAIWADTAWGRFWGWDPKETWALITWIAYTVYLHTRMVMGWTGRMSAIACLIGFVMVLITWIGVSYLPWFAGGLHTYASPGG